MGLESKMKHPQSSPKRYPDSFMERSGDTSRKDRGHRKTDSSQHKGRSSSPPENGPRLPPDHRLKTYPRSEKSNRSSRAAQDSRSTQGSTHIRKNTLSPSRPQDQDSSQEHWEKGNRNRTKSNWRPIREVLNVDTVLNELEQRRHQQHDSPRRSKPQSQDRVHTEQRDSSHRDERKQKSLMTIYEDEHRHETESHSSVDSERPQQRGSRLKGGPKTLLRSDTWTIQRTESGYESSDRLSSGSTNPDSPGVDGFVLKDPRAAEAQPKSQLHQKGVESKPNLSSPSHSAKSQGKSHEQGSHSHLKSSPSLRRKSKYPSSSCRKVSQDRDCSSSEQQEAPHCRGLSADSAVLRHMAKTSSSEWNSSDDLPLSEPEDREPVTSDSPCPHLTLAFPSSSASSESHSASSESQLNSHSTGSAHGRPAARAASHQGETSHNAFRPRVLQEPFSSPHLSTSSYSSPHRKSDVSGHRSFSDASSKSGSDLERSTPSSCDSEERLSGPRTEQGPSQEVSLTTYFNVDNCMTETYRLKYHNQRPLVVSASVARTAVPSERRDNTDIHSQDVPKARPDTSHNSNKPTAKWNPVSAKGLDERGFL